MVSDQDKALIVEAASNVDLLKEVDVSTQEGPDCVISFTTLFSGENAYDLELTEAGSGYDVVLFTSSETPLMQEKINTLDESQIDALFDHVIETIRELEGN